MKDVVPAPIEPGLFTLRETATLARVSEDQVRRWVESGLVEPAKAEQQGAAQGLFFDEPGVLFFSLLGLPSGMIELTQEGRGRVARLLKESSPRRVLNLAPGPREAEGGAFEDADCWTRIHSDPEARRIWIERVQDKWTRYVSELVILDWERLIKKVGRLIDLYRAGRMRVQSNDAILGGEPVFKDTRLAVRHIGGMRMGGEPIARIREDYRCLSADDVAFAVLYTKANPVDGPKAGRRRARV